MLLAELAGALSVLTISAAPADAPHRPLILGDHRTVELVSLGGAGTEALLSRVAADIGTAVERVEGFWGTDWSQQIVVVATGTEAQFTGSAGASVAAGTAAVTVADAVDPERGLVTGQRIVLAPGAAGMSAGSLRIVLAHELFHYASRAGTALDAPRWLTEGVADFVARPAMTAAPALPMTLPSDAELDGAEPQRSLAYDRAWWFARFIAERYGVGTLRALYVTACGVGHVDPAGAVRAVLDTDLSDLVARWQQWARS